jgi:hypothetical protein
MPREEIEQNTQRERKSQMVFPATLYEKDTDNLLTR